MRYVAMDLQCRKILKESDSYEVLQNIKTEYEFKLFESKNMYLTNFRIFDKTNPEDVKILHRVSKYDW